MNPSIRNSPGLLLAEMVLFVLIFIAQQWHLIPVSKIPYLFLVCWLSLRLRGLRWRDVGLARFRSWPVTLGLGAALGLAMELLQLFVTQPLLVSVTKRAPDLSSFRRLVGNPKLLVVMLLLVWTLVAIGEELLYLAFVFDRPANYAKGTRAAWDTSLHLRSIV